ncbi:hypothetical protein H0H81_001827 [Sphagnurus paluster]|uniref:Transcriptional repressor Tup1 N-terminal domain-containing protein n=1 Tax=Sphagnurus paluster TaxID=117069 RepID=A0A9P7GGY6_9AGAR|nr:hypothetical protein H0H81_001827 [Sphagnurus paluster]
MSRPIQHRSLQPSGPPPQITAPHTRLNDSFDSIRNEFDAIVAELALLRGQKEELEAKLLAQVTEVTKIHQSFYDLEAQHNKVRGSYDEELLRLRQELHNARQGQHAPPPPPLSHPHPSPHPHANPHPGSTAPHPHLNPHPGLNPPPAAPPPNGSSAGGYPGDPYYPGRERERDKEREREARERERERDRAERERESEGQHRERARSDADYKRGLAIGGPMGDRGGSERGGMAGPGERGMGPMGEKRFKTERIKSDRPGGPSTPGPVGGANPPGSFPDDLDIHTVPPELKKEGSDWFAVFNPNAKRVLDVSLVHTLMHESVVCCVRFSADGKFLATGCNRTAQIYDTKTGLKTCVLVDESAGKAGDLYIRSVCFSPDGKYLATGAEDKKIRIWDIAKKRIRTVFDGHQQEIYSLDFSADGRLIVSGSGDKTARIWDMSDSKSKVLTINDPDSLNNDAGVTSVAISPNGQFVAAGSLDTVVRIWDVASAQLVERLRGHRDSVYSVAFTPDGKGLVSGSLDKTLKYWDVSALMAGGGASTSGSGSSSSAGLIKGRKEGGAPANGSGLGLGLKKDSEKGSSQCTMNFTGHKDYVLSVAVSHDGQWVVSGSKDRGVQFWDSRSAIVQCMLQGHKNSGVLPLYLCFCAEMDAHWGIVVISIDLSPAGSVLATGSGDWQARICTSSLLLSYMLLC